MENLVSLRVRMDTAMVADPLDLLNEREVIRHTQHIDTVDIADLIPLYSTRYDIEKKEYNGDSHQQEIDIDFHRISSPA
jgi:hypothetical protein